MNNFLAALGAFLVIVLGAMFAVPHFIDWNQYRGIIEEETTRIIGRDFRIGGDVRLAVAADAVVPARTGACGGSAVG